MLLFVARAFQPEHIADSDVGRSVLVCGGCSPLTPDPSPPFHGGEGRIVCFCFQKRQQYSSPVAG